MLHLCKRGTALSISKFVSRTQSSCRSVLAVSKSPAAPRKRSFTTCTRAFHASSTVSARRKWDSKTNEAYEGVDEYEGDPKDDIKPTGDYAPKYEKFQELADAGAVHPTIIRQITKVMGHETMTEVQAMTINETISGADA
jgi:superfamily II DNA/RNA helicase